MNPIPIEALNLPTKWRRAAQATITAEGLALCHVHADELQAALGVDAQASSMEAWSTHMAQKESGQIVTAGAHGLEDGPEDPVTPPNQTLDEALGHAGDPVSRLNQALGEAFKDDPANGCRAHAAVLPLVVELAGVDAPLRPSTSGATDTDSNPKPGRTKSCDDPDCGCGTPVFTHPKEALEFLSGRFKFAGVSHSVALAYANDIDAILERMGEADDLATHNSPIQNSTGQAALDSQRLNFLIKTKLAVKQLNDTGLFMVVTGDDYPVTGEEFDTPYEAIDALMASDADFIPR